MITPALLEKKLFVEDKNDSIYNNNLFRKIDLIEFSGFETVLFNKQLTNLIHCPIIAKGKYSIPLTVDTIGIESFSHCKGITSIMIHECVKRIGYMAFENCTGLASIVLSGAVEEIGYRAFSDCTGLNSIYLLSKKIIELTPDSQVFHEVNKTTCILYVAIGTKQEYQQLPQWKEFQNIVETDRF
jgi:hypothetical protein